MFALFLYGYLFLETIKPTPTRKEKEETDE
jgi:hypothetical protein